MFRELDPDLYDTSASAKVNPCHSIERAEKPLSPKGTGSTLTFRRGRKKTRPPAHNAAEFHDAKAFRSHWGHKGFEPRLTLYRNSMKFKAEAPPLRTGKLLPPIFLGAPGAWFLHFSAMRTGI